MDSGTRVELRRNECGFLGRRGKQDKIELRREECGMFGRGGKQEHVGCSKWRVEGVGSRNILGYAERIDERF